MGAPDVDDVDDVIRELSAEVGSEVVPSGFDQQELAAELRRELLELREVDADVFPDGGVRATAGLHCADALGREGLVSGQELAVLLGENVVCYLMQQERPMETALLSALASPTGTCIEAHQHSRSWHKQKEEEEGGRGWRRRSRRRGVRRRKRRMQEGEEDEEEGQEQ